MQVIQYMFFSKKMWLTAAFYDLLHLHTAKRVLAETSLEGQLKAFDLWKWMFWFWLGNLNLIVVGRFFIGIEYHVGKFKPSPSQLWEEQ